MNKFNELKKVKTERISFLQVCLLLLSTTAFIVSNIIANKSFQMPWGLPNLPCAVFIFPVTYILSDIFSEVYGYRWSRVACYTAFILDIIVVLFFELTIALPIANNDTATQGAWQTVLGATPVLLIASMIGFLLGDFVNDVVFRTMKAKYPKVADKFFGRAIVSSVAGEIVDSFIFIPTLYAYLYFAFGVPFNIITVLFVVGMQVVVKILYEIVTYPVTKFVVKKIASWEHKHLEVMEEKVTNV